MRDDRYYIRDPLLVAIGALNVRRRRAVPGKAVGPASPGERRPLPRYATRGKAITFEALARQRPLRYTIPVTDKRQVRFIDQVG